MGAGNFKNWRGYLYVAFGVGYGFYRGLKADQWGNWDYIDILIALAMVAVGIFVIVRD